MQQEVIQAMLPHLQRRSELISTEVIAMLTDSQLIQLVSADDLVVETEMAVVKILEARLQASGRVLPEAYEVSYNMNGPMSKHDKSASYLLSFCAAKKASLTCLGPISGCPSRAHDDGRAFRVD